MTSPAPSTCTPEPSSTCSLPSSSTSTAVPVTRSPTGQVGPHLPAERRAGLPVRRAQPLAARTDPSVVPGGERGEHRPEQRRAVDVLGALESQGRGRLDGQLGARGRDVQAHADHRRRTIGVLDELDEDAGQLALAGHHVVGPLQVRRYARHVSHGVDDGEPGEQREPRPPGERHVARRHQQRERERNTARRLPGAVEPAAPGRLVLGRDDEPRRLPGPGAFDDVRVRRRRLVEDLDTPRRGSAADRSAGGGTGDWIGDSAQGLDCTP